MHVAALVVWLFVEPEARPPGTEVTAESDVSSVGSALPPAPPPIRHRNVRDGAWRGTWWAGVGLGVVGPAGGDRPGAAVTSGLATVTAGLRMNRWAAAHLDLTGLFYVQEMIPVDDDSTASAVGRVFLVDTVFRAFVPTRGRWQPFFDAGGTLGSYRAGPNGSLEWLTGIRVGAGVDLWINPTLSIALTIDDRVTFLRATTGNNIQGTLKFVAHW